MNSITVGGIQFSPDDPFPTPVIAIECGDEDEVMRTSKLLESLQNGTVPLRIGSKNPVYMGDTNIKVAFIRTRVGEIICEVSAKYDPRHLTFGFYAASKVSLDQVRAFKELFEIHHNYTFTVSCDGRVAAGALDIVKYNVTERGVPS